MLSQRFDQPGKVKLSDIPTKLTGDLSEAEAKELLARQAAQLEDLQELLYAAGTHSLLIVLQGRDTAGKDGSLKAIAGAMNPVGTRVASFKVPTPIERGHDFLWRVHQQTPGLGEVVFFNRSHYEDVLVVRVHQLAPEKIWKERYDHINRFEELLAEHHTIILKFMLHISNDEQEKRLLAREEDKSKGWKLNPGDWEERKFWDDYTKAYEVLLEKCSTKHAPWYVISADHKWYRNVAIAEAIIEALKPYRKEWESALAKVGEKQKAALAAMRNDPAAKARAT